MYGGTRIYSQANFKVGNKLRATKDAGIPRKAGVVLERINRVATTGYYTSVTKDIKGRLEELNTASASVPPSAADPVPTPVAAHAMHRTASHRKRGTRSCIKRKKSVESVRGWIESRFENSS